MELTKLPLPEALSEIRRTNEKIEAVTGVSGGIYPSALRLLESGTGAGGLDDRGRVDGGSQRLGGKKHRYW